MLKMTISNVEKLSADLFRTKLAPSQIRLMGIINNSSGPTSVLYLKDSTFEYDMKNKTISFDHSIVQLVNIGNTEDLFIITQQQTKVEEKNIVADSEIVLSNNGDLKYINSLTSELKNLGQKLLEEVRKNFNGELQYYANGKIFVERPDNFWAVKIQPRDKSLMITVRGNVIYFHGITKLLIKEDRHGFSRFKLKQTDEIEEAIRIIKQAKNK